MYAGVPSASPSDVSAVPELPDEAVTAFATPKSVTTATPPEMSTLSGLMSRCTTPNEWAYASAETTSRRIRDRFGDGELAAPHHSSPQGLA